MTIDDIIPDETAILALRGRDGAAILRELADGLAQRSHIDSTLLLEGLREREATGSTALSRGLALPHSKADVVRTFGVLGISREGVDFDAPDGKPVRVFLALVSPFDSSAHLQALACVSRSFVDPTTVDRIVDCSDPSTILAILRGTDQQRQNTT
jgi:mannitol/fructose-specific phosphotransferase system IIA component (Ntr-type)